MTAEAALRLAYHGDTKRPSKRACAKARAEGPCVCPARTRRVIWPCCWSVCCGDCGHVIEEAS